MMTYADHLGELQCPFCRNVRTRAIDCEGLTDKSLLTLRFAREDEFEIQVRTFCCGRYRNCEVCQAIMKAKYADDLEAV